MGLLRRPEQVFQTDPAVEVDTDPIGDHGDDLRAVVGWVDMATEGTLARGEPDDADDLSCHRCDVGVLRGDGRQRAADPLGQAVVAGLVGRGGAVSAGCPALAKWLVPEVKAPGTTMEVSMPKRASSAA